LVGDGVEGVGALVGKEGAKLGAFVGEGVAILGALVGVAVSEGAGVGLGVGGGEVRGIEQSEPVHPGRHKHFPFRKTPFPLQSGCLS